MYSLFYTSSEASSASIKDYPSSSPESSSKVYTKHDKDMMNSYEPYEPHDFSNYGKMLADTFSEYSDESFRKPYKNEVVKTKYPTDTDNEDFSQLSYKHVQYMLDDNQRLSDEVSALKAQLNVLNGDYVGLSYQYQLLEKKCQAKDSEIVELEGKVSALTIQLTSESEAKIEAQAKFSLAESTIESLNRQIGVMAKSDSAVRLRENYEAMLSKLRNQHENEMLVLKGENEGLKYELESKRADIEKLKAQLMEKDKLLNNRQVEKESNLDDLKQRYEEIMQQTCNKVEYETILKTKNNEIDSLRQEITSLKADLSNQPTMPSTSDCKCEKPSSACRESDYVKDIKEEFEKCLINLQTRRTQIASLQSQLASIKKENLELKEKLKETEKNASKTNEFLKYAHEPWIKKIESNYAAQFEKDLKEAISRIEATKKEEIEMSYNTQLEEYVDKFIEYLRSFSDIEFPDLQSYKLHTIFAPLRKLWVKINCNFEDRLTELDQKQQSMVEAREELERALIISKNIEMTVSSASSAYQEMDESEAKMKSKLEEYKRYYHRLIDTQKKEIEELKNLYAKLEMESQREYKESAEQLSKGLTSRKLFYHIDSVKDL